MYRVVLTFESVDEILKCDHSNKSYWAVLSCGTVYYAVQGGSNFWVCGWNSKVDHSNKSSWASLFCGSFCYVRCTSWFWLKSWSVAFQMKSILRRTFLWYLLLGCRGGFIFWAWGQDSKLWQFQWNLLNNTFLWCSYLLCCKRQFVCFLLVSLFIPWKFNTNRVHNKIVCVLMQYLNWEPLNSSSCDVV